MQRSVPTQESATPVHFESQPDSRRKESGVAPLHPFTSSTAPRVVLQSGSYFKAPERRRNHAIAFVNSFGSTASLSENDRSEVTTPLAYDTPASTTASASVSLSLGPYNEDAFLDNEEFMGGDTMEEVADELNDVHFSDQVSEITPPAPCATPIQRLPTMPAGLVVDSNTFMEDTSMTHELEQATSPKHVIQDRSTVDAAIETSRTISMSPELKDSTPMAPAMRYTVKKKLMKTLFGSLDLCHDELTGEEVVVKRSLFTEMHKLKTRQSPCKENAYTECQIMRKLPSHPNVLPLLDEHEDFNFHYAVMPYCSHGDALDYTLAQPGHHLSEAECKKLFKQALLGLQHMHNAGVCHLDISLENLLIDNERNIRLADFGLARSLPPSNAPFPAEGGTRPGKRYYMSPEIFQRRSFCGRQSDMWSMGVALFVMCFGSYPFKEPNINSDARFIRCYTVSTSAMLKAIGKEHQCPLGAQQIMDMLMCPASKRASLEQVLGHPWLQ